jgi:glycosyltransferase involved in cell wall biosynthesis
MLQDVQVIIPALNEEEGIACTISELKMYLRNPRILVVDGRSTDRTVEVAKNMGAEIVFQYGLGKGDALARAIECLGSDLVLHYVVITDADYTYPSEFVPAMIEILKNNPNVGMVCGNRFSSPNNSNNMQNMFYMGNRLLAFSHNFLNGVALSDPLTGLRVLRWEILKGWNPKSQGFDIEVELNHHVERKGLGIVEIPITYRTRLGEKKLKARHGIEILRRMLLETTY